MSADRKVRLHDSCTGLGDTRRTELDQTDKADNGGEREQVRRIHGDQLDGIVSFKPPLLREVRVRTPPRGTELVLLDR